MHIPHPGNAHLTDSAFDYQEVDTVGYTGQPRGKLEARMVRDAWQICQEVVCLYFLKFITSQLRVSHKS